MHEAIYIKFRNSLKSHLYKSEVTSILRLSTFGRPDTRLRCVKDNVSNLLQDEEEGISATRILPLR